MELRYMELENEIRRLYYSKNFSVKKVLLYAAVYFEKKF